MHVPAALSAWVILGSCLTAGVFSAEITAERSQEGRRGEDRRPVVHRVSGAVGHQADPVADHRPDGQADDPRLSDARSARREEGPPASAVAVVHPRRRQRHEFLGGAGQANAGTIEHLEFVKVAGGKPAVIVTRNAWLAPDGKKVCEDQRTLRFDTDGDARWIDFDITLKATDGPVTFGDTKEGTFGVRVAQTLQRRCQAGREDRQQPRPGRRRRVGQAGRVGRLPRTDRRPDRGHRHLQSPQQFSLSHLLARADLWPVRGQSVRSARVSGKGKATDGAYTLRAGQVDHAPLPRVSASGRREARARWPRRLPPTPRKQNRQTVLGRVVLRPRLQL